MRRQQRVASRRIVSRKRIEKRSAKLKISNNNSRKLQTFRSSRKPQNFLRKRQSRRLDWSLSRKGIENSLSWQLVAGVNSNFLKPMQGNSRHYGNFQRVVVWIFVLQKSARGFGKRASLTARRRSLDFRTL